MLPVAAVVVVVVPAPAPPFLAALDPFVAVVVVPAMVVDEVDEVDDVEDVVVVVAVAGPPVDTVCGGSFLAVATRDVGLPDQNRRKAAIAMAATRTPPVQRPVDQDALFQGLAGRAGPSKTNSS